MKRIQSFGIIIFNALLTVSLLGQQARLQTPHVGDAGFSFEYWKAKGDHIIQLAIPMTYIYPCNDKLRFYATTYPAFTGLSAGSDYQLGGLSDIKLGGHYLMLDDQVLLTFGVNLPTGKSALKSDEIPVASAMTLPAFELRVPSLGQGLDVQVGFNTAWEWGDYIVGNGISYLYKGPYSIFEGIDQSYNPGDELTITWGMQRDVMWFNREMRITADLLYTGYSTDKLGGEKGFSSGDRVIIQMISQFKEGKWDVVVYARERIKAPNKFGDEFIIPSERRNANGNQFQLLAVGYKPYKPNTRIKGVVDLKLYANNDFDVGGAILLGLGGGLEKKMSPQMTANGECRLYLGNIKQSAVNTFVFGLKVMGGIRYEF